MPPRTLPAPRARLCGAAFHSPIWPVLAFDAAALRQLDARFDHPFAHIDPTESANAVPLPSACPGHYCLHGRGR
ncbi:hypothetical protein RALTA_B0608 [Cupriavidus taiwanensis LMG 19424]|uniref:Uncharacterized protein n=1 Tax=Cupriavidus taiwanensis (strain DSM 17343 / BCRC 17206 / CCUG 44338 / CIP 107171 / LMG 19424 / R1) TaxID=977880 RepID=B3R8V9_CUPTR|nr:hypothetical protein RALTA_B0608 [Cupriavidus taiwanensis LMG 19424]